MGSEGGSFCNNETAVNKVIHSYTSRIRQKYGPIIKRVILYGSWARGEGNSDSDVDLLIITSKVPVNIKFDIIGTACSCFTKTDVYLSIKLFSEEEFEKEKEYSFIKTVLREGKLIV